MYGGGGQGGCRVSQGRLGFPHQALHGMGRPGGWIEQVPHAAASMSTRVTGHSGDV